MAASSRSDVGIQSASDFVNCAGSLALKMGGYNISGNTDPSLYPLRRLACFYIVHKDASTFNVKAKLRPLLGRSFDIENRAGQCLS